MAEAYYGTNIDKTKGQDEFTEVENLIKETLAETKLFEKVEAPAPVPIPTPIPSPIPTPIIEKKPEFAATKITPVPKPERIPVAVAPTPAPIKVETVETKYDSTFKEYKTGDTVKGKVLKVDQGGVLVDINYKADGLITPEELSDRSSVSPQDLVKVGDIIEVCIINLENKEGYVLLSKTRVDQEKQWNTAYDALKTKQVLKGKVTQALRGGLAVDCDGIRGFVPASQVLRKEDETLESFKDKVISVRVIEVNHRQGKVVMSHKQAAGEADKESSQKLYDDIEVGQVRKGKVVSLKNFGAFVDLGGVEGLIHLSELAWKRVKHPSAVVKVGQELDVFVLGVDKINRKIALGLKELLPDPWEDAPKYFKAGQLVKAKIVRFAAFGAFVELDHDLEGLIHISELSKEPVHEPGDAVKIGDVVEVKVLRVLPEEQRIGLSLKQAIIGKEREAARQEIATPPENKVTIGDMIAHKEQVEAEKQAEAEENEAELPG